MNFQNLLTLIEADVYGRGTPHKFSDFDYGVKPKLTPEEELKKYRYDAVRNKAIEAIEHGRALGFSKLVEPKIMSLVIGKYTLYEESPTWIYTWEQGLTNKKIITDALKDRVNRIKEAIELADMQFTIGWDDSKCIYKVCKIDKDNADLGVYSYALCTLNKSPFIISCNGTDTGTTTNIYFEKSKPNFYKWKIPIKRPGGFKQIIVKSPRLIEYTLDEKGEILHRLDGPAKQIYDGLPEFDEYWIDGRQLTKDQWAIISKFEDNADKQSAADMLNTLD